MRPDLSNWWARLLLSAAILAFPALSASAAAPVNDRCAGAIVIPATGPFPFLTAQVDITDATSTGDPPVPSCTFADVSRGVWYQFRPGTTDVYRLSTCAEAGTATTVRDTVMAIFTNGTSACGGTYVEIGNGCSDDACNRNSEITTILNASVTYFILVWESGTNAPLPGEGLVRVAVERGRPANDDCSTPQPVQLNIPVIGRTLFARNDYDFGNSLCFTGVGQTPVDTPGLDVVFSFTAPSNGTYSFKVKNYNIVADPNYDLVIYVSPTCPLPDPSGTMNDCLAAANRNLNIAEEVACLPLTNSQTVYIFVDDRYPDNRGSSFTMEVTRCIPEIEPNNSVSAPQPFIFETTGSIFPIGEIDYYALGMFPAGSRVFALIDAISANIPDFDLRVVTSTDTLEYDTDNNDIPYGQSSGSVAGTPLTTDCASLRITHVPQISEPYRIYAVVQPPLSNAVAEVEPNGTLAQAQSSPKNYFRGTLPNATDEDLYAFDAVAGDVIFIGLDADPLRDRTPIDPQLELLNAAGSVLMLVDDPSNTSNTNTVPGRLDASRPFSPAESIVCRATYTGRYYARVSISPYAQIGTMAGDYLLSITKNGFIGTGGTNTPPSIVNILAPSVPANTNATLTATIRDPDPGPKFTVTINWGDGSPNSVLPLDVCQYTFQATHQYPGEGTYPVNLTATDIYGGSGAAATTIQVTKATAASANIKRISFRPDHSVQLDLQGTPGAAYRIEISDNLRTWSNLASRTADGSGQFQFIDSPPLPQRRFYRAVWP